MGWHRIPLAVAPPPPCVQAPARCPGITAVWCLDKAVLEHGGVGVGVGKHTEPPTEWLRMLVA